MTLGEFRKLTAALPDDYELVTHPGDATFWELREVHPNDVLEPLPGAYPGVIILNGGQEVTLDYWIAERLGLDD